jgi:hypothetical protein
MPDEAYPVKWNGKLHDPSGGTAPPSSRLSSSIMPEAYPVKWDSKLHDLSGGAAPPSTSFTQEAYPVKWNIKLHPSGAPPHVFAGGALVLDI